MTSASGWDGILDPDEKILWQGQPDGKFRLRGKNIVLSLFGIVFLGSSVIFLVMAAASAPAQGGPAGLMFVLFGLPFVLVGLYLVFGIHWADMAGRRKTHYTLTNKHAFIATAFLVKRLKSYPINADTVLELRPGSPGSVIFAEEIVRSSNSSTRRAIGFELIPDAQKVYALMRDVQDGTVQAEQA